MTREMGEKKVEDIYQQQRASGCFLQWEKWKDKVVQAYLELVNVAKAGKLITYGELGRRLHISPDWLYPKIGWIVGACSMYEFEDGRPLISALVINGETNRPGKGFWGLPGIPAHLRLSAAVSDTDSLIVTIPEQDAFWAKEVKKVHNAWGSL